MTHTKPTSFAGIKHCTEDLSAFLGAKTNHCLFTFALVQVFLQLLLANKSVSSSSRQWTLSVLRHKIETHQKKNQTIFHPPTDHHVFLVSLDDFGQSPSRRPLSKASRECHSQGSRHCCCRIFHPRRVCCDGCGLSSPQYQQVGWSGRTHPKAAG